jgi:hypothetical protein
MPINIHTSTIYEYMKFFVGESKEIHKKFQLECRKEWNTEGPRRQWEELIRIFVVFMVTLYSA